MNKIKFVASSDNLNLIFGSLSKMNETAALFAFNKDSIEISCINDSKTSFLKLDVDRAYFSSFSSDSSIVKLPVGQIARVIQPGSNDVAVEISDVVEIYSKSKIELKATLPILMDDDVIPTPQKREVAVELVSPISDLKEIFSRLQLFSKFCELRIKKASPIWLIAKTPEGSNMEINLPYVSEESKVNDNLSVTFPMGSVYDVLTGLPSSEKVTLFCDSSIPYVNLNFKEKYIRLSLFVARSVD